MIKQILDWLQSAQWEDLQSSWKDSQCRFELCSLFDADKAASPATDGTVSRTKLAMITAHGSSQ